MEAQAYSIFSDFDGTISRQDSLKLVLDRFAKPSWRFLEKSIKDGVLDERQALQRMMDFMEADFEEVLGFVLDSVQIDPTFISFVKFCRDHQFRLVILSGGFIEFIRPLLRREGLDDLPVFANSCSVEDRRWKVIPRQQRRLCESQNHCKCASLQSSQEGSPVCRVYIGDGHTDLCVAPKADLIFAKSFLSEALCQTGQVFIPFESFRDVEAQLSERIEASRFEVLKSVV